MLVFICALIGVFSLYSTNINQTKIIWNTGLAMEADIKPVSFESVFIDIDEYFDPFKVKNGDVIWIQPQCLKKFVKKHLLKIKANFILLINTCDHSFPDCMENQACINSLLDSPKLIHIFAQNSTLSNHPKITQIPIGIDFHTLAFGRKAFGELLASTKDQEEKLLMSCNLENERMLRVCADFHLNDTVKHGGNKLYERFGETRLDIYNKLKLNKNIDFFEEKVSRTKLWQKKSKYSFSICPIGNGMDTHRLWEDLHLRIIPIVKSTPLDPLYKMFPIVIVNDWNEITYSNLQKWFKERHKQFEDPKVIEKLTQSYWLNLIKEKKLQAM